MRELQERHFARRVSREEVGFIQVCHNHQVRLVFGLRVGIWEESGKSTGSPPRWLILSLVSSVTAKPSVTLVVWKSP